MKGSENQTEGNVEEILDDSCFLTSKSFSNNTDDSHHPLATPAHNDPLLSPPSPSPSPVNSNNNNIDPLTLTLTNTQNPNENYLNITVSNPQKQLESSNSFGGNTYYVTYLITTKTNLPDYGGPHFTVRRRFKDVVTLSDRLTEAYRGFFIPPRPDKSVLESQVMHKQQFVEQRRNALEKYLHRLGRHPLISQSDELRVFLQNLPLLPTAPLTLTSRMVHATLTFHPPPPPPVYYDQDAHFLQNKERLLNLQNQLTNASKQAELFVKAQQDMSETMGAFGLSFIKLTNFENQHALLDTQRKRASDLKTLATAAIKASRFSRELNSQTVKHLDTLHDYMSLILGVHTAFSDRSNALLTVQTLTSQLDSLYSRAEKLETTSSKSFATDKPKTLKLGEVREDIRITEDSKSCATKEYERIKENNRTEIERLDRKRKVDFKNMLKGFVVNQVAFSEKIGKEWANVAEETSGYAKHDG